MTIRIPVADLTAYCAAVFERMGSAKDEARQVAASLGWVSTQFASSPELIAKALRPNNLIGMP